MKLVASLLVGVMMVAALAGAVSGAEEDTCAVLFDFGNGQVRWADVPVEEGMNAFNATDAAATALGLELTAQDWGSPGNPNMFIDTIEGLGYNMATSEYWAFWTWNSSVGSWEMAMTGPSAVPAEDVKAVAWRYAATSESPLATPEHRYPWTSFRYDALNSGMQDNGTITNITLSWSMDLGNGAINPSVIGANGLIYVVTGGLLNADWSFASNSTLFCLTGSGEEVWSREIGTGFQVGSPLLHGGMVIVPSDDGKVYAFDAALGTPAWTYDTGSEGSGVISSPIAYLGNIIFPANDGVLYSVHASNGTLDWSAPIADAVYSSSPAVHGGLIYIGADDGRVYAFAANGSEAFSTMVGGKVRASPLVDPANGQVVVTYAAGVDGGIAALDLASGELLWNTSIGPAPASAALAPAGYVAMTATGAAMVNFEGDEVWNLSLGTSFPGGAPTVVGDIIYAVTNEEASRLVAVSLDGELRSDEVLEPANYAISAPTFIDGVLYVAADNGYVYAFSTGTGVSDPNLEDPAPAAFPWLLVGGIAALLIVAAVGLIYWNGKKKGQ